MYELKDKLVVVSGASRGIGEASARALDGAGARVVLIGRTLEDLERVASDLKHDPVILQADLSEPRAGTELGERVIEKVGPVDVLVNNAGIPMRRTPDSLTEEDFDLVFSINVRSLLMLTLALGPGMAERGGGSIINISSIASLRGPVGRVAYAGTKGAVDAMTRALAADWGEQGIRVNAISPGPMKTLAGAAIGGARKTFKHTEINSPLRSNASLEAVGGTAVYLASDAGAYTTGEIIYVDGGYHILGMPQSENI